MTVKTKKCGEKRLPYVVPPALSDGGPYSKPCVEQL